MDAGLNWFILECTMAIEIARGRRADPVIQFSVFTPNRLGRLHDLISLLGAKSVHVMPLALRGLAYRCFGDMNQRCIALASMIAHLHQRKVVIVVHDADREMQQDLITAAPFVKPETFKFMAKYGRGLICVPTTSQRLHQL